MKLLQKGLLIILIPLVVQLVSVGVLSHLHQEAERAAIRQATISRLVSRVDAVWLSIMTLALRIIELHRDSSSRGEAIAAAMSIEETLSSLREERMKSQLELPSMKEYEKTVESIARRGLTLCDTVDDDGLEIPFYTAGVLTGELSRLVSKLEVVKKALQEEASRESLEQALAASDMRTGFQRASVAFVSFNLLLTFFLTMFFLKSIVKRITHLVDNTRRFSAESDKLLPVLGGKDEIAKLDESFHEMAGRVRESTRKERAMIDNAVDVICTINQFGIFKAVSKASGEIWGYEPGELVGRHVSEILLGEERESAVGALLKIREEESGRFFEWSVQCSDGAVKEMRWSIQWSEEDFSFFCVVHDVSERKALERLKQDFINMISHDLRTPLTNIRITLELISAGAYGQMNEKGEERVLLAQSSADRLIELVNQLLQLEKLEAGALQLQKSLYQVEKLLENSRGAVIVLAESREIDIQIECPSGLEASLDVDLINQVLINLLSNAIKFSDNASIISILASTDTKNLRVEVVDHGRGIPEEMKATIFDRFKQVESGDERKKGGTGLGLAICQAIVQSHGGRISVESEPGKGSTFWFEIPIYQDES